MPVKNQPGWKAKKTEKDSEEKSLMEEKERRKNIS